MDCLEGRGHPGKSQGDGNPAGGQEGFVPRARAAVGPGREGEGVRGQQERDPPSAPHARGATGVWTGGLGAGARWAHLPEPHHEAGGQAEDPRQPVAAHCAGLTQLAQLVLGDQRMPSGPLNVMPKKAERNMSSGWPVLPTLFSASRETSRNI